MVEPDSLLFIAVLVLICGLLFSLGKVLQEKTPAGCVRCGDPRCGAPGEGKCIESVQDDAW